MLQQQFSEQVLVSAVTIEACGVGVCIQLKQPVPVDVAKLSQVPVAQAKGDASERDQTLLDRTLDATANGADGDRTQGDLGGDDQAVAALADGQRGVAQGDMPGQGVDQRGRQHQRMDLDAGDAPPSGFKPGQRRTGHQVSCNQLPG